MWGIIPENSRSWKNPVLKILSLLVGYMLDLKSHQIKVVCCGLVKGTLEMTFWITFGVMSEKLGECPRVLCRRASRDEQNPWNYDNSGTTHSTDLFNPFKHWVCSVICHHYCDILIRKFLKSLVFVFWGSKRQKYEISLCLSDCVQLSYEEIP